jgi:hypothetical protein
MARVQSRALAAYRMVDAPEKLDGQYRWNDICVSNIWSRGIGQQLLEAPLDTSRRRWTAVPCAGLLETGTSIQWVYFK